MENYEWIQNQSLVKTEKFSLFADGGILFPPLVGMILSYLLIKIITVYNMIILSFKKWIALLV
jgi:hypothetical protein